MRILTIVGALALALGLGACGGSDESPSSSSASADSAPAYSGDASSDPEQEIKDATQAFYNMLIDGSSADVCALLTDGARDTLTQRASAKNCENAMVAARPMFTPEQRRALRKIKDKLIVDVSGDQATVTSEGNTGSTIGFEKVGDRWLISDLG